MFSFKPQLCKKNDPPKIIFLIYISSFFGMIACEPPSTPVSIQKADTGVSIGELPEEFDASYLDAFMDMFILDDPCDPNPCSAGASCEILTSIKVVNIAVWQSAVPTFNVLLILAVRTAMTGVVCVMVGCQGAEDCDTNEYCDTEGQCQSDICQANERQCQGAQILICNPDGSELVPWVSCPFGAVQCLNTPQGEASCACLDDWECPEDI